MTSKISFLNKNKQEEVELHNTYIYKQYELIREKLKFSRWYHEKWINLLLDPLDKQSGKGEVILDYCCGTSVLYPYVKKRYPSMKYVGIDISKNMLRVGKERFGSDKQFQVSQQDGEALVLGKEKFDVVIARTAIHHLPNPKKGLGQIYAILKDNGILVITEPSSNILVKQFRKILYSLSPHFSSTHQSFTTRELKSILQSQGFEIISIRYLGLLAYPFAFPDILPLFKYIPWQLLRFLDLVDELLIKVPFINSCSWVTIIVAEKKKR